MRRWRAQSSATEFNAHTHTHRRRRGMKKKKKDEKGKAPEFPFLSQETKKKKMASIKFLSFSPPGEPSSSVEVDFHLETIQQTGNSKGRERKGKKKSTRGV